MVSKRNRHVDANHMNNTRESNESQNSQSGIKIYFIQNNERQVGYRNQEELGKKKQEDKRKTATKPIYILEDEKSTPRMRFEEENN